jgi:hypothetical protein
MGEKRSDTKEKQGRRGRCRVGTRSGGSDRAPTRSRTLLQRASAAVAASAEVARAGSGGWGPRHPLFAPFHSGASGNTPLSCSALSSFRKNIASGVGKR